MEKGEIYFRIKDLWKGTIDNLETKAGLSQGSIGKWKTSAPKIDTLCKVVSVLGCSYKDLNQIPKESILTIIKQLKSSQVYPTTESNESIVCTINKARAYSNLEDSYEEYQQAEKDLESAKNNRNIRVFDAATGEWVLQADQNAIDRAQKNLNSKKTSFLLDFDIYCGYCLNLCVAIEAETFDKTISLFEDEEPTVEKLKTILQNALNMYSPLPEQYLYYDNFPEYHNAIPQWYNTIKNIVETNSQIKLA